MLDKLFDYIIDKMSKHDKLVEEQRVFPDSIDDNVTVNLVPLYRDRETMLEAQERMMKYA